MDLQSMDANLIKYPVQTMFESMEVTINPHFMPINLEPFAIFAPIPMTDASRSWKDIFNERCY
ncbi:hypothetical protein DW729_18395 [Bacteroides uniformis]|uniref:Uncharacterized protein n=1 Tax=Bacteroides uniformis TaxID=820 RepID=A0A414JKX4_BACUN|nr:hypothetical protein DXD55_11735 [Bacteroides stercoris]RHE55933.1 hypothetical protein DW729_18395 [Bacteroides uniformis]